MSIVNLVKTNFHNQQLKIGKRTGPVFPSTFCIMSEENTKIRAAKIETFLKNQETTIRTMHRKNTYFPPRVIHIIVTISHAFSFQSVVSVKSLQKHPDGIRCTPTAIRENS